MRDYVPAATPIKLTCCAVSRAGDLSLGHLDIYARNNAALADITCCALVNIREQTDCIIHI